MEFLAILEKDGEQFQKVVPIKIGDSLCYPVFLCLHAKNPGIEQLRKDLSRYRSTKQILKQLFKDGNNYDATDEWLHSRRYIEHFQEPKRTCDSRRKDLGTGYYLVSGLDLIRSRDRFAHQLVPNVHPWFFYRNLHSNPNNIVGIAVLYLVNNLFL